MLKNILLLINLFLVFFSCTFNAPKGPLFVSHPKFDEDKALVYIYRRPGESSGYDRTYYLMANDSIITVLKHGGYYPYITEPGKIIFSADVSKATLTNAFALDAAIKKQKGIGIAVQEIEIEVGHIYYLQFYPEAHFTNFSLHFKINENDIGENDLKKCRLLEKYIYPKEKRTKMPR